MAKPLKIGLLKFDFLGLRNLTVIQECIDITGEDIDLLKIDYNDPKVMGELSTGDTIGVFQLESSGMRDVIRRLKPTCLEDIIAIGYRKKQFQVWRCLTTS